MNIAILGGTGKEGAGLARRWALAGHSIIIGSRDRERAKAKAAEPVMGKLDRIPAAIVRGLTLKPSEEGSKPLLREPARDLFR